MTCPCGCHQRGMLSCSNCCNSFTQLTKEINKIDRPREGVNLFKCEKCSYICDSDLNGSYNISLKLLPIGKKQRLEHKNRTGFYWNVINQECIVSGVQEE